MKRKIISLTLASVLVLGSASTVLAAPRDVRNTINNKDYKPMEYLFDIGTFVHLANNMEDYIIEGPNEVWYKAEEVNAAFVANPSSTLEEAVVGLTPVNAPVEGELKVTGVSAINGKEVEVKFNKAVDKSTVITGTSLINVTFTAVTTTPATPAVNSGSASAKLSTDGKTLTITPQTTEYFGGQYVVNVPTAVKDQDGKDIVAYASVHTLKDSVRPSIGAPENTINGVVSFKATEPINANTGALEAATSIVKPDGTSLASTGLVTLSADNKTINLDVALWAAGKNYTVTFIGLKDFSGNIQATNPVSFTVQNKSVDDVDPVTTNIEATKVGEIKITVSEKLKATANKIGEITIDGATAIPVVLGSSGNATLDATGTIITVTEAGLTAGVKTIVFQNYADLSGNNGAAFTKLLNFKTDIIAPKLVSNAVQTIGGIEYLVLTFDENVTPVTGVAINGKKVVDFVESNEAPAITTVTAAGPTQNLTLHLPDSSGNSKSVKLDLTTLGSGEYTLDIAGIVIDTATLPVASTKVTFARQSNTDKPVLTSAGTNGIVKIDNDNYSVNFDRALDPTTALNVNNYVFEGATVKSAIFTQNNASGAVVKLTLNPESVALTGDRSVTVKNVKSAAGVLMDTVNTTENLVENIKPTITEAKIMSTTTIKLKFSELVAATNLEVASGTGTAFEVYIDGVKSTITDVAQVTAATTNPDTEFLITFGTVVITDTSKPVTVKILPGNIVKDTNGNDLKTAGTITAIN